jgi:ATP-dependent exoDNAse (exonuclease V) alpha subunit
MGDALPALDRLRQQSAATVPAAAQFDHAAVSSAHQAVLSAIASLAEREQAFSHERLRQTAMRVAIGQANPNTIDQSVAALVKDKILIPRTVTTEPDRDNHADTEKAGYTTQNAIRTEMRLFALLDGAKGVAGPLVSLSVARAVVEAAAHHAGAKGYAWNQDQRAAAIGLLRSPDSVALLQGWGGTAKTSTVLATVAATARAGGFRVEALAPTRSAAKTIGDALNTQGDTVHNFLGRRVRETNQPRTLGETLRALFTTHRELWIVDEMSLLGTGKTVELLEAARERGAKVLLTGDKLQLGSVKAGKAFIQAQNRSLDVFRLNEIVRQKTRPGRDAVRSAIERNAAAVLQFLESDAGRVEERSEQNDRIQMMAERYASLTAEQRNNTLLIDPSREGNEAIKAAVRTLLQSQGELAGPTASGKRLLDAGLTNADKTFAVSYHPGNIARAGGGVQGVGGTPGRNDQAVFVVRAGSRVQGIDGTLERNEYVVVTGVDAPKGQLQLQKPDGATLSVLLAGLDPSRLDVFEERPGDLRRGDRIRWNRNDRQLGLARGDFGTVTDIRGNLASITFDAGAAHTIDVTQRENQHYDYGYAVTAYGAQGQTKDWIFHAESWRINLINWRSFYVGVSRGETSGTIVTDNQGKLIAVPSATRPKPP